MRFLVNYLLEFNIRTNIFCPHGGRAGADSGKPALKIGVLFSQYSLSEGVLCKIQPAPDRDIDDRVAVTNEKLFVSDLLFKDLIVTFCLKYVAINRVRDLFGGSMLKVYGLS